MKQRITVNQINELSEEQKNKLMEWWQPQRFDHYVNANMEHFFVGYTTGEKFVAYGDDIPHGKEGLLPVLSNGQMIELLRNRNELTVDTHKEKFGVSYKQEDGSYISWDKVELCDALWEAVKATLVEVKG